MATPESTTSPPASDREDPSRPPLVPLLVPPAITVAAVVLVLVVARIYDRLPIQAPGCGLRMTTGIPCVACGGTRSMMALSHGRFSEALAFNPLLFFGVFVAGAWLLVALFRVFVLRQERPRARRLPLGLIVTGVVALFVANWVYLWLYLPE